ncbi:MAG: hypothetical protein ABSA64_00445 [Sedimentisphaerales bacterium]
MKKLVLLTAVVLFGMVAPVLAAEGDLHGFFGITYDSLHVWRGYVTYGADSAINPFIDLDLFGSGFHLETVYHQANGGGNELGKRFDYSLYYAGAIDPEETLATMYKVGYRYFNYPQMSAAHSDQCIDLQEVYAGVAFPKLLGVKGLVPGYAFIQAWPSMSNTVVGGANPNGGTYQGCAHVFMLDYALPLESISAEIPKQDLNFHVETVYNNHVDPRPGGAYTTSDWTHVAMGVSTDFDLGNNLTFTPGYWHQITMEDNGNKGVSPDHDIDWVELTVKYKF